MIALALLLAAPFVAEGPDARFDCVLGPRGTRDRDRAMTVVVGGFVAHMGDAGDGAAPPGPVRIGGAKGLFKGGSPTGIAYHAAGGADISATLADGRQAVIAIGKRSEEPGTVPVNLDVKGTPAYLPLSGGCTLSTGDFATLAAGVGS